MFELLKTLTELPGMIGHEDPVQEFLLERWQPHCEWVRLTKVGNVIAKVGGTVFDGSLRAQLEQLRASLTKES